MGDSTIPWRNGVCFTGEIWDLDPTLIYQDDSTCDTRGDLIGRRFYFNVTNSDKDSILELSDVDYSWQTSYFNNGQYTVGVRAFDVKGNVTVDSMNVTVENFFTLSGTISIEGSSSPGPAIVTIVSSGQIDTVDNGGLFSLSNVGGGSQLINISREGYPSIDTVIMMNIDRTFDLVLPTCCMQLTGDVDGDPEAIIDIGDLTALIGYLFIPPNDPPICFGEANVDGDVGGIIDIGDLTALIGYLFIPPNDPPAACQ